MTKKRNLTGQRFGRWLVLEEEGRDKNGKCLWKCKCDCGTIKAVMSEGLVSGKSKSCGCYKRTVSTIHGSSGTRIWNIYNGIRDRCLSKTNKSYYKYGGRGIIICDEWKNDFVSFREWSLNNGYNEKLSIDRIDVNGNYEPLNCRWTTNKIQSNNKRNTIRLTINGVTKTMLEWSNEYKIPYGCLRNRFLEGWEEEFILIPSGALRNMPKTKESRKFYYERIVNAQLL